MSKLGACCLREALRPLAETSTLPGRAIEWLTDNGSPYIARETRAFARQIGLDPVTTPVCSPQSNGMAESFVKTLKRDYIAHMPIRQPPLSATGWWINWNKMSLVGGHSPDPGQN